MICPDCGFEQARGTSCQQCGTHMDSGESATETARGQGATAPATKPGGKHRNRPLHDLDMTISMPEISPDLRPEKTEPPPAKIEPHKKSTGSAPKEAAARPPETARPATPPRAPVSDPPHRTSMPEPPPRAPISELPPSEPVRPPEVPIRRTPSRESMPPVFCTTTSQLTGQRIVAYHGLVTSTAYLSGKILNELSRGAVTGGGLKGTPLDLEMKRAHERALENLRVECSQRGGNAVVGISYSPVFEGGGLWLFYSGTAVTVRQE